LRSRPPCDRGIVATPTALDDLERGGKGRKGRWARFARYGSSACRATTIACDGGQRARAEYLLGRGADRNWIGHDALTPIDAARRSEAAELVKWLEGIGARSRAQLESEPREDHTPGRP